MAQEQVRFNEVKCSVELFNKVLGVIAERPYREVGALVDEIKVGFVAIPLNNAKADTPKVTEVVKDPAGPQVIKKKPAAKKVK